jgi:hypothetical protein
MERKSSMTLFCPYCLFSRKVMSAMTVEYCTGGIEDRAHYRYRCELCRFIEIHDHYLQADKGVGA